MTSALRSIRSSKTAKRAVLAARAEQLSWLRRLPIQRDTVFYESFAGNGMLCNPEAIFRELLAAPDMQHLKHVWSLSDLDQYADTVAEFAGNRRVRFVRTGSTAYLTALSSAKYLVNNATFPQTFAKRAGQIYLNTWHGTPLKAMGYDVPGGAVVARNVVRNFLNCDYLLAPNAATQDMYLDSYRTRNLFAGRLIHEGTPRIDHQFQPDADRRLRTRLRSAGLDVRDSQQIVLYAPTWKGDFYAPTNDIGQLRARVETLRAKIDTERYEVLLKVHQQVYQFAADDPHLAGVLVPNAIPTNDVLAGAAVLVTDYSSIFTDFLTTGRPILFFMPDLADYETSRGLNLPVDEWPGPILRHIDELANHITAIGTGDPGDALVSHAQQYAAVRARYCPKEDGHAAARVVDIVFRGHDRDDDRDYDIRRAEHDGRETLLIYIGGVLPNGITMSALSLLENIDYDRFDVSVFFPHQTRAERVALLDQISERALLFPRVGGMLGSKFQTQALLSTRKTARRSHARDLARFARLLRDEWTRCFGNARFDYIVDFSGYSPFWPKVLIQGEHRQMSIWLHNDLVADSNREVDGRFPHRANLEAIFEVYRNVDHLVSVSRSLAEVNREKLRKYAGPEKFSWARNTIDGRRVLVRAYGLAAGEQMTHDRAGRAASIEERSDAPMAAGGAAIEIPADDLRSSIGILGHHYDLGQIKDEVERRAEIARVAPDRPGVRTFVTVGRLSPEKNHLRLIEAFAKVHHDHPDTRLVIIGTGPLRQQLTRAVAGLGLNPSVTLAGHLPNPFGVMSVSDCLVLSSDYEGQPMVLLEALVLGLPVISTDFASVTDALPEGCGHVVERSVDALAEGMRAFLRGELTFAPFDYVAYNHEVMDEFYAAIGARDGRR